MHGGIPEEPYTQVGQVDVWRQLATIMKNKAFAPCYGSSSNEHMYMQDSLYSVPCQALKVERALIRLTSSGRDTVTNLPE